MTSLMQQANAVLNAQGRGFVEGVISTTELYVEAYNRMLSNSNLEWAAFTVKSEVVKNLKSLNMSEESIEYWVEEYFGE